ncbi:putative phage abortive infection protein [Bacillus cereus group sp. BfR-BA-01403]|uniref:putative phage abortive infection protein n=1 Tax=Bacillus cereus group sp. BfR-BA-01403 TaxID=2920336 RepID=UPI001F56BA9C|nr:putative phage abortive infection protein [Bacillus cereus group sp. BfR-BA-01403]
MEKENKLQKWFSKIETWGIIVSAILIVAAVCSPIYFYFRYKSYGDYTGLAALGPVGDFIGGTTVAFLTAASVILLIATNIMQRKELKISQQQNEVSIQQADLAREETKITNGTMKKQQFETTFFNMVTLHQNIVGKLQYKDKKGNEVIESSRSALRDDYYEIANSRFKKLYVTDDYDEIVNLIAYLQLCKFPDVKSVQTNSRNEVLQAFNELDFRDVIKFSEGNKMIREFFKDVISKPNEDFISEAYHNFDVKYDSVLGSYFNSITTIIKFLRDSQYEIEDRMNNKQDNKIYREIFFSQFAPNEMMVIYYYAKYRPDNEWLLEELKAYNLFYSRLVDTLYLFWAVDRNNIGELSK